MYDDGRDIGRKLHHIQDKTASPQTRQKKKLQRNARNQLDQMSDLKLLQIAPKKYQSSNNILSSRTNGTNSMNQLETQSNFHSQAQNRRQVSTSYSKKRKKLPGNNTCAGWMHIISETISPWIQQEQKTLPDPLSIFVSDTPKQLQQLNGNKKTNSQRILGYSSNATSIMRQKYKRGSTAAATTVNQQQQSQNQRRANSCSNQQNIISTSNGKVFSVSMIKRDSVSCNKNNVKSSKCSKNNSLSDGDQQQSQEKQLQQQVGVSTRQQTSQSENSNPENSSNSKQLEAQQKQLLNKTSKQTKTRPLSANNKPPTFPKKMNQISSNLFPVDIMNKNRVPQLDPIFEKKKNRFQPPFSQNKKSFKAQQIQSYSSPQPPMNKPQYSIQQKKMTLRHPFQSPTRPRNYQSFQKALLQQQQFQAQQEQQYVPIYVKSSQTSLHKSNSQKPALKFIQPSSLSFVSPKQQLLHLQQQQATINKSNYNQSESVLPAKGLSVTGSGLSVNKKSPVSKSQNSKIAHLLPNAAAAFVPSNKTTPKQQNTGVSLPRRVGSSVGAMRVNMSHIQAKKKATMNLTNQRLNKGENDNGYNSLMKQDQVPGGGMLISDILKRKQYSSSQTTQPSQLNYLAKLLIKNSKHQASPREQSIQNQNDLKPVAFSISNKSKQNQRHHLNSQCLNSKQKLMLMMMHTQQQQRKSTSPTHKAVVLDPPHSRNPSNLKQRKRKDQFNIQPQATLQHYISYAPQFSKERHKKSTNFRTLQSKPTIFASSGSNKYLDKDKALDNAASRKKISNHPPSHNPLSM